MKVLLFVQITEIEGTDKFYRRTLGIPDLVVKAVERGEDHAGLIGRIVQTGLQLSLADIAAGAPATAGSATIEEGEVDE